MSAPTYGALVRNDLGGLEPRWFSTAADAAAVSQARELPEPPVVRLVAHHPSGGFTHALRMAGDSTARVYVGWYPTRGEALRSLK